MTDAPTTNGLFLGQAEIAATLKQVIAHHLGRRQKQLAADQTEALDVICSNIAAIINGNPDDANSWSSISGVSRVVVDRLIGTGQYKELAEHWAKIREQEKAEQEEKNERND